VVLGSSEAALRAQQALFAAGFALWLSDHLRCHKVAPDFG